MRVTWAPKITHSQRFHETGDQEVEQHEDPDEPGDEQGVAGPPMTVLASGPSGW